MINGDYIKVIIFYKLINIIYYLIIFFIILINLI